MPTELPATAERPDDAQTWTALRRYRVMAYVTGTMLLLLTLEVLLQWVVNVHGDHTHVIGAWVPITHGWVYVVYLVTVYLLWTKMRWGLGRLVTMVLAGVVPVMSFVLERAIHRDVVNVLGEQEPRTTLAP